MGEPGNRSSPRSEAGSEAVERHRRRVRRFVVAGVVLGVALLVALGVFAYLWTHSGARPVTLEEARRRFLEEQVGDLAGARRFTPAEGVYAYLGSGTESLSSPPKSQSEGPEIPGTVSHRDDGCWTFRLDYSTNHWREWDYCVDGGALVQEGSRVFQRWDFVVSTVDNLTTLECRPPGVVLTSEMRPGDVWESECRGRSTRIDGTTVSTGVHTFVGREEIRVGGRAVDTLHFRDRRVVSGAQQGGEVFEMWLTADGLPVQGRQRIEVDSDSPIGRVTYTQESAFSLVEPPG